MGTIQSAFNIIYIVRSFVWKGLDVPISVVIGISAFLAMPYRDLAISQLSTVQFWLFAATQQNSSGNYH
ncbi:hypothetical protein L5L91_21915 [Shewanella sp. SM55]|uniref:hypothetical protein n=1 Tax=Shewanella sp. SM55 TaxID=2912800 RepID=UPI0021DAFF41|nr:hypothetical protein [Shewanella sp. SM55]MCU8063402.1 hypothetical protein [Shewanella sp. SM55]